MGKFDAAIMDLRISIRESEVEGIGIRLIPQFKDAVNVLEAAGKVGRGRALDYLDLWFKKAHELLDVQDGRCHDGNPCKTARQEIRALLEALPEDKA